MSKPEVVVSTAASAGVGRATARREIEDAGGEALVLPANRFQGMSDANRL